MPLKRLNIFEKMRGIFTPVTRIRREVLIEVAKMVKNKEDPSTIETIPYKIISKNTPSYRSSVFHERAIVRERTRLAFGMELKEFGAHNRINDAIVEEYLVPYKKITRPIVNVIKIGCERCPEQSYIVSDLCRGCIAHPCTNVCPKNAVSIINGKSFIDQVKCIKCGKCEQVCPYNAIIYRERPCKAACGVNAIISDEEGFAQIDDEKCVSCGLCIISCPFGAIAEKSEIAQVITALNSDKIVLAEIAPSFVGQFGPLVTPDVLIKALNQVGFKKVAEVAYGADVDILLEVKELSELIKDRKDCLESAADCSDKRKFVGTSCCPAWVKAAQQNYPELSNNLSESFTPMVETAKKLKKADPDSLIVFIGPCISKKLENFDEKVAKYVDFIITFEELAAVFLAFDVDPTTISHDEGTDLNDASELGRGFPVAGGVIKAITSQYAQIYPDAEAIPTQSADTLKKCLGLLKDYKRGKLDPTPLVIEGMACPHGCIGGPGTLAPLNRAKREVNKYKKKAQKQTSKDLLQ